MNSSENMDNSKYTTMCIIINPTLLYKTFFQCLTIIFFAITKEVNQNLLMHCHKLLKIAMHSDAPHVFIFKTRPSKATQFYFKAN